MAAGGPGIRFKSNVRREHKAKADVESLTFPSALDSLNEGVNLNLKQADGHQSQAGPGSASPGHHEPLAGAGHAPAAPQGPLGLSPSDIRQLKHTPEF